MNKAGQTSNNIWFQTPAKEWLQALPIGNGRIGVMVFGGIETERLALSESTVWSGRECPENDNPDGPAYLGKIQEALFPPRMDDKNLQILLNKYQGKMENYGTSRPFGDMEIAFSGCSGNISEYRRSLDISTGIATTQYSADGICYNHEYFISHPDKVVAIKIKADKPGSIGFHLNIKPVHLHGGTGKMEPCEDCLIYNGRVYDGEVRTHARIAIVQTGGTIRIDADGIELANADEATLYISMASTFRGNDAATQCCADIKAAVAKGYEQIKSEHMADIAMNFDRLDLELGESDNASLPIDERLKRAASGESDPDLDRLWYQYARYLTLSGSRNDSPVPMHLQGIWNDNIAANMCWTCDFHLDINAQMIQWLSTPGNLPETNQVLGSFIENILMPSGSRTASINYGKNGWVAHTMVNAWGYSSFLNTSWSMFPTAGAWLAASLWDQYEYFMDKEFLRETTYPILKQAAQFFLEFLIHYPGTGYLVTAPSISPENGEISVMPTSDRVILYGLFDSVIKASAILDVDAEFRQEVRNAKDQLPPLEISPHGQLMEWFDDQVTDGVTGHRHFSHLLALFPYDQITPEETPELLKAAETSINRRVSTTDWEETEFTGANLAAFYARMKDGNKAYSKIGIVMKKLTAPNLFTMSPAGIAGAESDIFIIDGNLGIAAAMSEMLIQSHRGRIELLPALPYHWGSGTIKGIVARGGFEIVMAWEKYKLVHAVIESKAGSICTLVKNSAFSDGRINVFKIKENEQSLVDITFEDDKIVSFKTDIGNKYRIEILN